MIRSLVLLFVAIAAVSAQVNCFFNPDDPGVFGGLDAGSAVWWNSSTAIGWKFSGPVFSNLSGLQWHIHQYIASDLSTLTTTGAHYNTLPWKEGELSDLFGNITSTHLAGGNSSTNAFPLITTGTQIIGRSVTLTNAAGTDIACCNIGFYLSGGNQTVRCTFVGSQDVSGYIDFTPTSVNTRLLSTSGAFNGQTASWEIRTNALYGANCGNAKPLFNGYNLAITTGQNLTLNYQGYNDSRNLATNAFALSTDVGSTLTISGRSITLHRPDGSRYATCNIGYGTGPIFDGAPTPTPPPTTEVPTGSANSLSFVVALVFAFIAAMLF